jgi:hypothetical protein
MSTAVANDVGLKFVARLSELKEALRPALEVATKGALKDHTDFNRISLTTQSAELIAKSYGGRLAITVSVADISHDGLEYVCDAEGQVTVNATDLAKSLDAFADSNKVVLSATDSELSICPVDDEEEVQSLPLIKEEVEVPPLADEFEKEIKIDRRVFLDGLKDVEWAVGFEDHKENYHYIRLVADTGSADFMAGTGGRFRVYWVTGDKFLETNDSTEFFFHKDQIKPLTSVLSSVDDDYVTIKQASRSGDAPDQIVFAVGAFNLMSVGFDTTIKWPNVKKAIKEKKPYSLKTKVSDWEFATKGLLATFNEEVRKTHDTHESDIEPKIDKKYILLSSKSGMKAQRKIPILDVEAQEEGDELRFHCTTAYVADIVGKCDKNDEVLIQYHQAEDKPVFVLGPEKDNAARGVTTRYCMFFASMKD